MIQKQFFFFFFWLENLLSDWLYLDGYLFFRLVSIIKKIKMSTVKIIKPVHNIIKAIKIINWYCWKKDDFEYGRWSLNEFLSFNFMFLISWIHTMRNSVSYKHLLEKFVTRNILVAIPTITKIFWENGLLLRWNGNIFICR
jgi:hypothetical protein